MTAVIQIGDRFDRLLVTAKAKAGDFVCQCDCGAELKVKANDLVRRFMRSCGCLKRERLTTHGQSNTPEFASWMKMRGRCLNRGNPSYRNYGGRGIKVCARWDDFSAFLTDMGKRPSLQHSIERIDNEGNYEPGNCRWATPAEQSRNKRDNRMVTLQGKTMCITDWARSIGISPSALSRRLRLWNDEGNILSPGRPAGKRAATAKAERANP